MRALVRTFLFTDIEGSYRQWERHPEAMPRALAEHDAILQRAVEGHRGRIFKTVGDAICAVFDTPLDGLRAAVEAQRALYATPWETIGLAQPLTVRMALQAGEAEERDGDFSGLVLNRISRLLRAGHGGQVLVAPSVAEVLQSGDLPGVGLRDFGERRLRDVPGANRIYQLEIDGLPISFPPLVTLETVAHNLPVILDSCLGRESELALIRHLLLDSPARVVTLLGPGGIGKTRLALHAATQLIDAFSGGVWFVDLAGVRDGTLAPAAVASVLGGRVEPGSDPMAVIAARAGDRNLLLILDNCEQIVEEVARLVAELLPHASGVRVLATSRVPLQIRGEQRVDVGPLPVEAEEAAGPAVQLFLERAQQIRPSLELTGDNRETIYEICHRVDGIPLALELAAARVAALSPDALRARLSSRLSLLTSSSRDLPERHQTLRAAIAWSYALLTEAEQRAFRILSVFQGGWSFAAAQAVLELDELEAMDVLASLRDKSLIRLSETDDGDARYSMLETIQEFGFEQLGLHEEMGAASSLHASFYAGLTNEASSLIEGGAYQRYWLNVLDSEISNIRAALRWSLDAGNPESGLDIAMNCWFYWSQRGLAAEGQRWFEQMLAVASQVDPTLRAGALRRLGNLCVERGELRSAEQLYRASVEIERAHQNLPGLASSLTNLGTIAGMLGYPDIELELQEESLAICRQLEDVQGIAMSLFSLAVGARNRGEASKALALLQEVVPLQIELEDEIGVAFSQTISAWAHADKGDFDSAGFLLELAERTFSTAGVDDGLYLLWSVRASLELARNELALATVLIGDAVQGYRQRGDKAFLAGALETQAAICARAGECARGAELLGEAQHLRALSGLIIPPVDEPVVAATQQMIESSLGTMAYKVRWETGRQQSMRGVWAEVASPNLLELLGQTVP